MRDVAEKFELITNYDLISFLDDFATFIEQYSPIIIDFYSGNSENLPQTSITELERLLKESNKIEELFQINRDSFQTSDFVDLIDLTGDIKVKLLTIQNSAKWTRSSITDNRFNSNIEIDTTLSQNQTLEQLSGTLGYLDQDNDWSELAIRNNLKEENYTSQGGIKLKASLQNNMKIVVQSVVDTISGQSIYGKDLQKKFEFIDNDLKVLSPKDTIEQAFGIAVNLRRGDNQEFPTQGLQSSLIIGNNINSVLYPSLFRQLYQNISQDDTFKSISITNVSQTQNNLGKDCVSLEINAQTRLDETIQDLILL
jgi:hypothetical protein